MWLVCRLAKRRSLVYIELTLLRALSTGARPLVPGAIQLLSVQLQSTGLAHNMAFGLAVLPAEHDACILHMLVQTLAFMGGAGIHVWYLAARGGPGPGHPWAT